jgi:hypothetical protein
VLATVSNYVRPPTFDEAATWLRRRHLVVLEGAPGSGRRAGAMALLREVTDGLLVALSPTVTAQDLAEWEDLGRYGYFVIDNEGVGRGLGTDPAWADVAERVRYAGTYLVVTTTAPGSQTNLTGVPHFSWERPPTAEVLRRHLAGNWAKNDVDRLVDFLLPRLPANYTLRWLACVARLVNARRGPAQALQDMEEMCGRQVNRWFDQPRTRQEIAEVTAAAFLAVANERRYRSHLAELEQILMGHEPDPTCQRFNAANGSAGGDWQPTAAGDGLIQIMYVASAAGATGIVSFKKQSYQRHVLSRIWGTSESRFLEAVRKWIDGMVAETERLEIASALALLACSNVDEVESSFLDPWSLGRLGWPGKVSATYVLWCMCREETTAPLALLTAIRWANSADANQRTTAMMAFSGELGVSYPTDAARRLWQLMTQTEDLRMASFSALGHLFAVLVDQSREANAVLTMLDAQHTRFCLAKSRRRMRRITIEAILATLTVQSHRTARPAVAELLYSEPECLEIVARLWASLIRSQTAGRDGVAALWSAVYAFQCISREPASEAGALGRALSRVLSDDERSRLKTDLARLDKDLRNGSSHSPADALVACQEALRASGG